MRELSVDFLTDTQQGEAEVLSTLLSWVSKYASLSFWTGWDEIMIYSNPDFAQEEKKYAWGGCDLIYGHRGDDFDYSEVKYEGEGAKLVRWGFLFKAKKVM